MSPAPAKMNWEREQLHIWGFSWLCYSTAAGKNQSWEEPLETGP